jgi:hypothetical protein
MARRKPAYGGVNDTVGEKEIEGWCCGLRS